MLTRSDMHVKSQDVINLVEIDASDRDERERPLTNRMKKYAKKILDPREPFTNWISLMFWVMSISMDPLFFYIPVIKMDKNCLDLDIKLAIVSCVFRSVIDLSYIIYINFQRRTDISAPRPVMSGNSNSPYRSHKGYIDLLAVLPMPQVVIIIILLKSSLSKILEAMNVLKYIVFFQYVPRVIRIYPLFRKAANTRILAEVTWVKAAFNLYLYMLSGHVFGALWYFFAIDTEIQCWKKACSVMNQTGCNHHSFNCHKSSGNYKFLNDVCSTKSLNKDFYDFGIYLDALQSGVVLEGSFLQKFTYCFRWGLQSLSCFAQNLVTSINMWENIFTISITISSVVLFIFLLGNMQLYLQSETAKSEEMKLKVREIEQWTTFKKLSDNLRLQVQKYQQHVWRETKGVDVQNLLNNLPSDLRRNIKRELCLKIIKKVPIFELLREQQLNAMCIQLKPVLYPGETYIVRKGDPVDEMLFIMRGTLLSLSRNGSDRNLIDAVYLTEFCGEELSLWAIDPQSKSDQRPLSTSNIKTVTEVEAFALMADDLKDVFTKFKLCFHKRLVPTFRFLSLRWRCWAACIIQVAWRCYRRKKLEERMHEDEKKLKNALAAADGSSTSSVSGTIHATKFAAKAIRAIRRSSKARMRMRAPTMFLRKPADPDFSFEDEE
ncbi:hypothetical protein Ddye_013965 [Dipteronia dyeriana]|uniref:Cyclic nucleotide-binding domain-containing protein n=1 Tax=Dipteronia dyeriana TaxID=168575 RepID=A0AAD9X795_9ROSI|nr:hypothetical protein Ddye_013965 [Dipteronia dyeriana]